MSTMKICDICEDIAHPVSVIVEGVKLTLGAVSIVAASADGDDSVEYLAEDICISCVISSLRRIAR